MSLSRMSLSCFGLVLPAIMLAAAAQAEPHLLGIGQISRSPAGEGLDLSGLTGTLENGLPKAVLGGTGSGLAYAGNGVFLGLPDRGPNDTPHEKKINDTATFIPRFETLKIDFTPAAADARLPLTVTVRLTGTTLLWSASPLVYGSGEGLNAGSGVPAENTDGKYHFTGRSDAYDPKKNSCNPANGRLDSESIRVSNDGKSVFISDEYGPYLYQFDRATGKRVKAFDLPANLCAPHLFATKKAEISGNKTGRTANKGMEGLAITPDGKMLLGAMQAALLQDRADKASANMSRLVSIDLTSGQVHQYGYMLAEGSVVSDIVAVNDHEFLVDERDGDGLGEGGPAGTKGIYLIDLKGARDITDLSGAAAAEAAVKKVKLFDLVPVLAALGVDAAHVPAKIEGLAFGPDVTVRGERLHTLVLANDNDFLPEIAGPNMFYVLGFSDQDLPGYVPRQIAMMAQ